MDNTIYAHIFGRNRKGDREEAKLLLFNADGSEFLPGVKSRKDVTGNYSCDQSDVNVLIYVDSPTPVTITLRDQNLGDWWLGEELEIYQAGVGEVTLAAPSGTTLIQPGGALGNFLMPGGRFSTVKLRCMDFCQWVMVSDTVPPLGPGGPL